MFIFVTYSDSYCLEKFCLLKMVVRVWDNSEMLLSLHLLGLLSLLFLLLISLVRCLFDKIYSLPYTFCPCAEHLHQILCLPRVQFGILCSVWRRLHASTCLYRERTTFVTSLCQLFQNCTVCVIFWLYLVYFWGKADQSFIPATQNFLVFSYLFIQWIFQVLVLYVLVLGI